MVPPPPDYDPTGWSATDPATWPQPIPPATLYQPGMVWTITAAGVVDGQTVAPGDLLYAIHRPRRYGDGRYGDGMYGSTPAGNWSVVDVAFLAWSSALPRQDQPPAPYSGCPFGDTGWWIILEAWFENPSRGRTYGELAYGDDVYGGGAGLAARWEDITAGFVDVTITRGNEDGNPSVDATELAFTWYDPEWVRWDLAPPARYDHPFVGAPIRVSFYDPEWRWYPRAVGAIEQIQDAHGAPPRFVTVEAFGHTMDLDRSIPQWQRSAELASARTAALLEAAAWRWGLGDLVYPAPDVALHRDAEARDVTCRSELDRTALSSQWQFDTTSRGTPRLRRWPLAPAATPDAVVVDCADHGTVGVVATVVTYTADQSQLINFAVTGNSLEPPDLAAADDATSRALYGIRDNALGWPALDLAWDSHADGNALAVAVRDRYARLVTHIDPIEADSAVDLGWLPVLAATDTGATWSVVRVHPFEWTLDGIVVGLTETITPDRIVATVHTTTTTPTT